MRQALEIRVEVLMVDKATHPAVDTAMLAIVASTKPRIEPGPDGSVRFIYELAPSDIQRVLEGKPLTGTLRGKPPEGHWLM